MRNYKTNHRGLSAVNLSLHNHLGMFRYEWRHRHTLGYPLRFKRRLWEIFKAAIFGWEPWRVRLTKRGYQRAHDRYYRKNPWWRHLSP